MKAPCFLPPVPHFRDRQREFKLFILLWLPTNSSSRFMLNRLCSIIMSDHDFYVRLEVLMRS